MANIEKTNLTVDDFEGVGEDKTKLYVEIFFKLLICVVGVLGNFIVIFIILVLKEYKKSITHWYILQLALADSLFLLSLPFQVSESLNSGWVFSNSACKAVQTIMYINYYSSMIFLMIMSIDRYIAVCHSFSDTLQRLRKSSITTFVIAPSVWIIAILLCIPVMLHSHKIGESPNCICGHEFPEERNWTTECIGLGYSSENMQECLGFMSDDYDVNPDEPHCRMPPEYGYYSGDHIDSGFGFGEDVNSNDSNDANNATIYYCNYEGSNVIWRNFIIYNFIVMFALPMMVMVTCYALIVYKLKSSNMKPSQLLNTSIRQTLANDIVGSRSTKKKKKSLSRPQKDRRRVTIMCGALVSCFIICWLPFHSIHLAKIVGFSSDEYFCATIPLIGDVFAFLNSALNPILYTFLGYNFDKRWSIAALSVRRSLKRRRRRSSSAAFGSVRQRSRSKKDSTSSNNGTATTRFIRKQTIENSSTKIVKPNSSDVAGQSRNSIDIRHHRFITNAHDDGIIPESPLQE